MNQLAQVIELPSGPGTPRPTIEGPIPQFPTIASVITKVLPLVYSLAGIILFLMLLWGGYDLMFSGGDAAKAQSAKGKITYAILGFIIVFVAWWLTQLTCFILGCEF